MHVISRLPMFLVALALLLMPSFVHAGTESETRQFLYSAPNTYGWQPVEGGLSYDFFKDGRLHVQGSDGEATMWEGTWKLKGNQVTLIIPDLKTKKTVTVGIDGDDLLLDGQRYRRYQP